MTQAVLPVANPRNWVLDAASGLGRPVPNVFHVGLRKTGTTYLQKRLLPLFADRAIFVSSMNELDLLIADESRPVILSNEGLATRPGSLLEIDPECPKRIAAINPHARVILTIRSQFTVLRSMYGLAVKMGYLRSFSAFIDEAIASGAIDYFSVTEAFRKVLGTENVTVILFEQLVKEPRTVVQTIAERLGVAAPAAEPDITPERGTPGDLYIEIGRISNRILGPRPRGWKAAVRFMAQVPVNKLDRRKPWLLNTKRYHDKLSDAFAESNERLFQSLAASPYYEYYPRTSLLG
jgi:hypothetical protein